MRKTQVIQNKLSNNTTRQLSQAHQVEITQILRTPPIILNKAQKNLN